MKIIAHRGASGYHPEMTQDAYEKALDATSTDAAPWYVIPADSKTHRNLMIARLMVRTMKAMKLAAPVGDAGLKGLVVR